LEAPPYCCPNCHANRAYFALVVQAVDKDPHSGRVTGVRGEPVIESGQRFVRCRSCGFHGPEGMFVAEARRRPPY